MSEMIKILVIFSDRSSKPFLIEPKTTVRDFKELVAQSIDLKDEIYFGFCIKDDRDGTYWLCDNKIIMSHEYFKGLFSEIILYFVIKYFYEIQNVLSDDVVKYFMYHQLKYDIYSGNVECDSDLCFQLLAMTLLIDGIVFENFCEETKKMSIIPLHLFTKHPSVEHCIWKIEEKYNELLDRNDDNLMDLFISLVFQLPTQISHLFLSKDFNSSAAVIGINKTGFVECSQNSRSSYKLTYSWNEISNITSNKSRVNFDLQDPYHNRSSLRRKSCANTVSYEVGNSHLAKSIVYLAKDTLDFISTYRNSPSSTLKSSQYKSEKRNMTYVKKFNSSTSSRKGEKSRLPITNIFLSESSVEMSRSPSRISLSSSTFNGSCHTNDSASLQYDDDSFSSAMSLQELKLKFTELNSKRLELQNKLSQKVAEALELSKTEFTMTCKVPSDHKLLDPLGAVYFTKNPLPSRLLCPDNQSNYQSEKNRLLLQIETISNIYEVLRKTPKSEKKFKKELENKKREISNIKNKLNSLEMEHANDVGGLGNCRSNSVGNLNRISSKIVEKSLPNGNSQSRGSDHLEVKINYVVPLTEPSQRRFIPHDKSEHATNNWSDETHPRIKYDSENTPSPIPRYRITTSKLKSNEHSPHSDYCYINSSNFQRFHSARSIIKGPLSLEKVKNIFTNNELLGDSSDHNSSSISNASIEDDVSTLDDEISDHVVVSEESSVPSAEMSSEYKSARVMTTNMLRHTSTLSSRVENCRDSMEINHDRLNVTDCKYSRRILSKYNKQNRKSSSLEELKEEECTTSVKFLARRDQKELSEPLFSPCSNKVTYRPSIRDGRPCNLTRGKQPSIVLKQARNNSLDSI